MFKVCQLLNDITSLYRTRPLLSLLLMFSICVSGFSQNWDVQLLRDINLHRNKDFDPLYRHISNSVLPLTLGLPLGVIVYEQSSGEGVGSKKRGLEMLAVTVGTVALSQGIKWTLNRERPYEKYPEIDPVYLAADPSFPSGHTASAFALATSATLLWPKW